MKIKYLKLFVLAVFFACICVQAVAKTPSVSQQYRSSLPSNNTVTPVQATNPPVSKPAKPALSKQIATSVFPVRKPPLPLPSIMIEEIVISFPVAPVAVSATTQASSSVAPTSSAAPLAPTLTLPAGPAYQIGPAGQVVTVVGSNAETYQTGPSGQVTGPEGTSYPMGVSGLYGANGVDYNRRGDTVYGSDGSSYVIRGDNVYGSDGNVYTVRPGVSK